MGLPDFDLYIFGIRSSLGFQNGMSLACPVLFLNLTCGADVGGQSSNSVSRQASFNRTKIGGKCQHQKIQMGHFE